VQPIGPYTRGVHSAYTGQGEGTNVEANNTSGGGWRPVRHKIPLGILIFLVYYLERTT